MKLSEGETPVKTVNKAYTGMGMFIIAGYSMALIAGFAVIILVFRLISKIISR